MYDGQLYRAGVHSLLLAEWKLTCATPLVIRSGVKVAFSDSEQPKTRYRRPTVRWEAAKRGANEERRRASEVAALCYRYEVVEDQLQLVHYLPPSSVRGALRSWTVRTLVEPAVAGALMPAAKLRGETATAEARAEAQAKAEQQIATLAAGLAERSQGVELIASLFGLAADTTEAAALPTNAGRLQVETEYAPRAATPKEAALTISGKRVAQEGGPGNGRRQLTVRSPIDRVAGIARDGGLHQFIEFARGEQFTVRLRIVNPCDADVGLLGLWASEITLGFLRFGALSSIGRGRMAFTGLRLDLWQQAGAPRLQEQSRFKAAQDTGGEDEALAGLWQHLTLPLNQLPAFIVHLKPYTGGGNHAA